MNNTEDYKKDLKRLFDALPHGGISEVARRCNMSVTSVQNVRDGKFRNEKVVLTAIDVIREEQAKRREHEDLVRAFVQELPPPIVIPPSPAQA